MLRLQLGRQASTDELVPYFCTVPSVSIHAGADYKTAHQFWKSAGVDTSVAKTYPPLRLPSPALRTCDEKAMPTRLSRGTPR